MNITPVSRQKVVAVLKKQHQLATKTPDRISWHWSDGFKVYQRGEQLEVWHEMGYRNRDAIRGKLAEYQQTLEQAGIYAYVANCRLVVAGQRSVTPEPPPEQQPALF